MSLDTTETIEVTMHGAWLRAGLFLSFLLLSMPAFAQPTGLPDDLSGDAEAQGFADLLFAHGMVQLAASDYAAALPLFEKASRTLPGDATYAYFAALCKLRLGRQGEAVEALRAVLPPAKGRVPESRIRYDLADGLYRTGDYEGARRELKTSIAQDDQAAAALFYLGLVEFARGETRAAFDAFGKASALDASFSEEADYYSGVEAYERGDLEGAREYFEKVLAGDSEPDTARSGRSWVSYLSQLGGGDSLSSTDFRVSFFVEHDENPGQLNDDFVLPGADSDVRGVLKLRAAHRPLATKAHNIGLVLNGYVSRHADFEDADLAGVQGVFQYAYGGDPMGYINGPLGYARVPSAGGRVSWLFQAGASNLSRREGTLRRDYEAASTLLFHQPTFGKSEVSLSYDDATFFDDFNVPYSGHNVSARVGQYFFLGAGPNRYLRLLLGRTTHTTRERALERDSDSVQAEFALPVSNNWTLFLLGAYREDEYDSESAKFFGIAGPREDETVEAIAKLTLSLTPNSFLTFQYSFIDRESDALDFATYDRSISSVGYTRQW